MPSLTVGPKLIWFAHCPKAGGTSIESILVNQNIGEVNFLFWGWDKWFRHGGWRSAAPPCSPQHLIWDDAALQLPRPPDSVFAVVRDPVERLQSEWRWQRNGRRATILGKALARLPFDLWAPIVLAMCERYPYTLDNHIRPQTDFVPETANVFRLEEGLHDVTDWLSGVLETPLPEPCHELKTVRCKEASESIKALISHWYAADFERFGYERTGHLRTFLPLWAKLISRPLVWMDRCGKL